MSEQLEIQVPAQPVAKKKSALDWLSKVDIKADGLKAEAIIDGVKVKGLLDFSVEFDMDELPILTLSMRVASVNYREDGQI